MPLLLLAVMVVPALIMVAIVNYAGDDELPTEYTAYAVNLQIIISVFVAAAAPQAVSRDLRFRTVALYFSRPLSRVAYVNAKFLAMTAALFAFLALPLLILFAGALLAKMDVWDHLRDVAVGLAGALVFAVVLAGIGLVIAAFTPRRGLGVAAVITVLMVLTVVAGTVQGIADDQGNDKVAGWAGLLSPYSLVDGVQYWVFRAEYSGVTPPPVDAGGPVFVAVTIALVAGCYGLLMLRFRRVSVS